MATLGLVKSGIDRIQRIESKGGKVVQERLAPTVMHKEGFYRLVVTAGFGAPQPLGESTAVTADTRKRLAQAEIHPVKYIKRENKSFEAEYFDVYKESADTIKMMATRFRQLRNRLAAFWYNNAFSGSYTIYDGQYLCSTAHTSASGYSTRSNRPASGGALGVVNLEIDLQSLYGTTDPVGEYMDFEDMDVALISGNSLRAMNHKLTETDRGLPQSANNDNNWAGSKTTSFVTNYITSSTAWFLRLVPEDMHGIRLLQFTPVMTDADKDTTFDQSFVQCKQLLAPLVVQWEGVYGNPGT